MIVEVEDLIIGTGKKVISGSEITVHYSGSLLNGIEFDSSIKRRQPLTITVSKKEVIDGWEEGLVGMQVGGTRKLIIPPEKAYGKKGINGIIPENATLVFEINLLKISD